METDEPPSKNQGKLKQSGPIKWKCNDTFTFIVLLRQHPCLWDPRHADYASLLARKQAIVNILSRLKMPEVDDKEVKNKIKSLKKTYHMELYKLLSDDSYEPRAYWFRVADAFMRDAALKPDWIIMPKNITDDWRNTTPAPDLTRFALESYQTFAALQTKQQRLYRQAVAMIMNELLEEQDVRQ